MRQHDEDYYQGVKNLKTIDGVKIGEWRGGNCQSIIFGQHPNHTEEDPVLYRTNGKKVSTSLRFKDIVWPENVKHCWVEVGTHQKTSKSIGTDTGTPSSSTVKSDEPVGQSLGKRITAYMLKVPASIEGQGGDDQLFRAACTLVQGFNLTPAQALPFLEVYNERSEPLWDLDRLIYKLDEAEKKASESDKPRGHLLKGDRDDVRVKFTKALEGNVDTDALKENTIGLKESDLEMVVEVLGAAELSAIKRYQVCKILSKPLKVSADDLLLVCAPKDKTTEDPWSVEPWQEPVDGELLLDELTEVFHKHVALPENEAHANALWTQATHLEPYLDFAPILRIGSPQKRCGKSTLLDLLDLLVRRPLKTVGVTVAGLFRTIEDDLPTVLMDEAETFIKGNEEMRGIIDSGYQRNGIVIRCNSLTNKPEKFHTWSFKAIAGLGRLPDTIEDRAIPINLQRRKRSTVIVKLRDRDQDQITRLRRQCVRWAIDNGEAVRCHRPMIPDALNDRAGDVWYPMFCVADTAGDKWSKISRNVSLALNGSEVDDDNFSVILLLGLRAIVQEHENQEFFFTSDLILELNLDAEAPWMKFGHGDDKGITAEKLASTLRPYKLKSDRHHGRADRRRSYTRTDLEGVFDQYLEKPVTVPSNNDQPGYGTRQSSPRLASHVPKSENSTWVPNDVPKSENSTWVRSNQVPDLIPEVCTQVDSKNTHTATGFPDLPQNGRQEVRRYTNDKGVLTVDYSQSKGNSGHMEEGVLESGLTVEQTKYVRDWLTGWHKTLDNERQRVEVDTQKEHTRRYLEEEFFHKHPVKKSTHWYDPDAKQYDLDGARALIAQLQAKRDGNSVS